MTNSSERMLHPPVGFIVEGRGEYYCYPSLVSRIVNVYGISIPVLNARGTGNIVRHLEEHLNDIVSTHHPYRLLVSLDLRDNLGAEFNDCSQLRQSLLHQAGEWLQRAQGNPRLRPLPDGIEVIIQIQQFESWMLSDINNLMATGYVSIYENQCHDVDNVILNPAQLLGRSISCGRRLKDPRFAKSIITHLDPETMRQNSRSFDKFLRETQRAYQGWCQACEFQGH